jgi:hypothetical protein
MPTNLPALEALDRLRAGDARFASTITSVGSQGPTELVFEAGLGELIG